MSAGRQDLQGRNPQTSNRPRGIKESANEPNSAPAAKASILEPLFAAVFGAFLGLCLLKFGSPPIMESFVEPPQGLLNMLATSPWPLKWALWTGVLALVLGVLLFFERGASIRNAPRWLLLLPLAWLGWQTLATLFSVNLTLSVLTLLHFVAAVICFYLGFLALARVRNLQPFWIGLLLAFLFVLAVGLDQHFGGLEDSRKFFYQQQQLYPNRHYPPELLKKIASGRIYSTLFYPNTLAGALLLLVPPLLVVTGQTSDRLRLGVGTRTQTVVELGIVTAACLVLYLLNSRAGWMLFVFVGIAVLLPIPRWIAPLLVGLAGAACLYWCGSKGGWLLMLVLGVVALMRTNLNRKTKSIILALVLLVGLSGFFLKYLGFFQRGATSVAARFDYWRAAAQTSLAHPMLGTGPGTFASAYEKIKRPESEMARLVHNDYLEQASDSGIPGCVVYTAFIVGSLILLFPRKRPQDNLTFATWLGALGWSLQCCLDFSLYIPALAWIAFTLLGWLGGTRMLVNSEN